MQLSWEGVLTIATIVLSLLMLGMTRFGADLILIGAVTLLLLAGVLTPDEALKGMSNEGMVTVGVLFIVAAGIRQTGGIDWMAQKLLGKPKSAGAAIARMYVPTAGFSAFVNNTPLVSILIPVVNDWAKQLRIPASKLMLPLSYAAILGGMGSLIGTSTNLVVNGMYKKEFQQDLGMFDVAWVGIPAAIFGGLFLVLGQKWLLPDRRAAISRQDDPREYTVEMTVAPDGPLVGKTIEVAGMRHLPGVFLAEIDRAGHILPAVSPTETLQANDRLIFVGIVDSVVDLHRIRGLLPAPNQVFKLDAPRATRCLIEAVVSNSCPLVGQTIRDGRFRSKYNAVVIAVARNGERLKQKIGDIQVHAGDTLLLEAHPTFVEEQRNNRDFFLISRLEDSEPRRHERSLIAMVILIGMVALVTFNQMSMLKASMLAAGLMMFFRCVSPTVARRSIDWEVLLAIAAASGLSTALEKTGVAAIFAKSMIGLVGNSGVGTVAMVYLVTLVVTELVTNNAAAQLMFPLSLAVAKDLGAAPMPFVITVMMAASCGFATPIGYQTNLMVYGPGGYRYSDYLRVGVPLDLLIGVITVAIVPWVWPLFPAG